MAEIFYPYNESFKFYAEPRAGKRAQTFIDQQNQLKGGRWVLHTKQQHDAWWKAKGLPRLEAEEFLKKMFDPSVKRGF